MTITPQSSISSILPQPAQSGAPAPRTQTTPADSVQLSAAATAHLKSSGDPDGDGH